MTLRWYSNFIEREYCRLFLTPRCPEHGVIEMTHILSKEMEPGVVRILCPRCELNDAIPDNGFI